MTAILRLGVMGSGTGSNFDSILRAIDEGRLDAEVKVVLSDVATAPILDKARRRNIPAHVIKPNDYESILGILREAGVDLVVLAGYMRIVKKPLLDAFPNRVVNIHPALLPKFPGLEAWVQALEAGVDETGCTVHFVDEGVDTGPIIKQAKVPCYRTDTPETLHKRIQVEEHKLLPEVLQLIAEGRVKVENRKVIILDSSPDMPRQ